MLTEYILWYRFIKYDFSQTEWQIITFVLFIFPSSLEVVFSLLLIISACYIASYVRNTTGKKQNTCLLIWHIFNLLILIIVTVIHGVLAFKRDLNYVVEDIDAYRYKYYGQITSLVRLNTEFYVDLFLLWLLYRFMKP